jgi:predicted ATPase/DNA-binding SARP family transcriptional activator
VRLQGHPLPPLRSQKSQWLLALLALQRGRAVQRAWLAGTLWPESSDRQAAFNLTRNLSDLRRALGPTARRLEAPTSRTLRLDLVGVKADVLIFDEAIAAGDPPSLAKAVALRRGPLLQGCTEEWVLPERLAREEAYLAALERLAAEARAEGDLAAAAHHLRQLVAVDPLRESAQRALMELLAAGGGFAAATQVYREFRLLLHRELNAAPDPETDAAFRQIRAAARQKLSAISDQPSATTAALADGRGLIAEGSSRARDAAPAAEPRAAPGAGPARLPRPLTRLVGREAEVRRLRELLRGGVGCSGTRLITLTGPGGVGKTRLAIQVAAECVGDSEAPWADGVCFVDLSALRDPALIPQAVAAALAVRERAGGSVSEALEELLRVKALLLVLDNCEHLLDAAARLAERLLEGCPALRLLATSRQSLGLTGEVVWRVPPLSLPVLVDGQWSGTREAGGVDGPATSATYWSRSGPLTPPASRVPDYQLSTLLHSEAIRLFVERGMAADRTFTFTEQNAPAVAEICRRLDGLPLAIELAAAWLKTLSVEQIAARLDDRFRLLTSRSPTAPTRQQTLRAAVDWSYDLLSAAERLLLQRLSVFAGSFTLEAVEAVCGEQVDGRSLMAGTRLRVGPEGPEPSTPPAARVPDHQRSSHEVLDLLSGLVDKSLVSVEAGEEETRYRLLETVRQYAGEKLCEAGEAVAVERRHAAFYLCLAEEAAPYWRSADLAVRLERLDRERDNLRAALDRSVQAVDSGQWSVVSPAGLGPKADPSLPAPTTNHQPPTTAAELALRLAAALAGYWEERRHLAEGRQRLAAVLGRAGVERRSAAGAAALEGASALALLQEDRSAADALLEESLSIRRERGERAGMAAALAHLARLTYLRDDFPAARVLYEQSLAIHQERGDRAGVAAVLAGLGHVARRLEEYSAARSLFTESLLLRRALGDRYGIAESLVGLANTASEQADVSSARALYEEALALRRELGDRTGVAQALADLASLYRQQRDYAGARRLREESLSLWRALGSGISVLHSLGALGHLAREQGEYGEARRYYAESLRMRQEVGDPYTIAQSLEDFAELAAAERQWRRMARLLGAAHAQREAVGKPLRPRERAEYDRWLTAARGGLEDRALAAAWAEGEAMVRPPDGDLRRAIGYALQPGDGSSSESE